MPVTVAIAAPPEWSRRFAEPLHRAGVVAHLVDDAKDLEDLLGREWTIDIVVLDLALATPSLADRLEQNCIRLLAFGDAENAGFVLWANLADFVDDDPVAAALIAAIFAGIEGPVAPAVADLSDRSSARLGALGAEAERVAAALRRLGEPAGEVPPVGAAAVRALIRARQLRARFFPGDIFGEPAWDMLLDLTLAREEGRSVPVSNLCLAAGVPTTTALRAIHSLCGAGVLVRRNDPDDARRAFIALAEPTARAMAAYLAKL